MEDNALPYSTRIHNDIERNKWPARLPYTYGYYEYDWGAIEYD